MFKHHPTKPTDGNNNNKTSTEKEEYDETVIGTSLIKGGGMKFPASGRRTDHLKNETFDNECYYSLYSISPTYQSQALGCKLLRAVDLYAHNAFGYEYAVGWILEGRTPELLA